MKSHNTKSKEDAQRYQHAANILSITRAVGGVILGLHIAKSPNYQRASAPIVIGLLAATDALDGMLARKAEKLDKSQATPFGARVDEIADKVFTHSITAGTVCNAIHQKNAPLAIGLGINQAVQLARDVIITKKRNQAERYKVKTNAQWSGKIKTFGQLVTLAYSTTPEARDPATLTLATATSMQSIISGASLHQRLDNGIAAKLEAAAEPTFARDDTSQEPLPDNQASAPR